MSQDCQTLILIPTKLERDHLRTFWPDDQCKTDSRLGSGVNFIEIVGFGPIVAAAQALRLIHIHRPRQILLLGIAGSYRSELKVGEAYRFTEIACYGIGVGTGDEFQTAEQMGWQQWTGDSKSDPLSDKIRLMPLATDTLPDPRTKKHLLLSVTAAAKSDADVQMRQAIFSDAVAEDMEGFGVAAACHLMGVPLAIIRGISNRAGDRNFNDWQIEAAMQSAGKLVQSILNGQSMNGLSPMCN